jgi:predicted ATPase with chaperone activity
VLVLDDLHEMASHDTLRRVFEQRSVELDGVQFPARARLLATTTSAAQIPAALLDRFDLVVPDEGMVIHGDARPRIALARARQHERLSPTPWSCNAEIPRIGDALPYLCRCHARRQHDPRVLRVARTIADLQPDRDTAEPLDADTLALAERLVMEDR